MQEISQRCWMFNNYRWIIPNKNPLSYENGFLFGDPWGNRTPVTAVKGRCLDRLTNGPLVAGIGFEPMTYRV